MPCTFSTNTPSSEPNRYSRSTLKLLGSRAGVEWSGSGVFLSVAAQIVQSTVRIGACRRTATAIFVICRRHRHLSTHALLQHAIQPMSLLRGRCLDGATSLSHALRAPHGYYAETSSFPNGFVAQGRSPKCQTSEATYEQSLRWHECHACRLSQCPSSTSIVSRTKESDPKCSRKVQAQG